MVNDARLQDLSLIWAQHEINEVLETSFAQNQTQFFIIEIFIQKLLFRLGCTVLKLTKALEQANPKTSI